MRSFGKIDRPIDKPVDVAFHNAGMEYRCAVLRQRDSLGGEMRRYRETHAIDTSRKDCDELSRVSLHPNSGLLEGVTGVNFADTRLDRCSLRARDSVGTNGESVAFVAESGVFRAGIFNAKSACKKPDKYSIEGEGHA